MNFNWELQKFDTDLFGFKTAKVNSVNASSIKYLLEDLQKNNIQYATYRLNASDFPTIHALEKNNFLLVDGTIALENNAFDKNGIVLDLVRDASEADIPLLKDLAANAFNGTRFFVDPAIPKSKAQKLYATWIENSVKGSAADKVLVWEENKKILGFVTLQKNGHIGLIAVSPDSQGKGIGKKLIQSSFVLFKKWDVKTIILETQTTNIAALRTYQGCNFKIVTAFLTYRWSNLL
jgi:ribosomal protein S18 acetylase RimI-like enzyme